ncbi:hypothetical protein ACMA1D_20210 [Streptomyces sp. 796.1]|uniref:hypothetical protein n=1 Tax=Streptomyces sp. 796.1 TaxID=3163029 RepID=UPI0039C998C2
MNTPRPAPLEGHPSTTNRPGPAKETPAPAGRGAPKDAARKGVRTALRPNPRPDDGRQPIAWLHITAPRDATPTARSWCACGRDRFAAGHHRALALIADHTTHRTLCPLRNPQEGRAAA